MATFSSAEMAAVTSGIGVAPAEDWKAVEATEEQRPPAARFGTLLVAAFALVALGARPGEVMWRVIREGMTLTVVGVGLGLAGAFGATKLMSAYLFGVGVTDPLTFSAAAILLMGVAFVASSIPSRRAVRVDPLVALRTD